MHAFLPFQWNVVTMATVTKVTVHYVTMVTMVGMF